MVQNDNSISVVDGKNKLESYDLMFLPFFICSSVSSIKLSQLRCTKVSSIPIVSFTSHEIRRTSYHKWKQPRNSRSTLSSSNCCWPTQRGNPKETFCQQPLWIQKENAKISKVGFFFNDNSHSITENVVATYYLPHLPHLKELGIDLSRLVSWPKLVNNLHSKNKLEPPYLAQGNMPQHYQAIRLNPIHQLNITLENIKFLSFTS